MGMLDRKRKREEDGFDQSKRQKTHTFITSMPRQPTSNAHKDITLEEKPSLLNYFISPVINFFSKYEEVHSKTSPGNEENISHINSLEDDAPVAKNTQELALASSETLVCNLLVNQDSDADDSLTATDTEDISFEEEIDPFAFIKMLPNLPATYAPKPVLPPTTDSKMTLVLDLDETLVHCSATEVEDYDHKFIVTLDNEDHEVYASFRPHVKKFLKKIKGKYEIVVFTASQEVYASQVLDLLDTDNVIDYRLYRDSCVDIDGNYLKELSILGRDLSKVVIVDNSIIAFGFQVNNGIPIISWYDDKQDRELLDLLPLLEELSNKEDVRPILKEAFELEKQVNEVQLTMFQN